MTTSCNGTSRAPRSADELQRMIREPPLSENLRQIPRPNVVRRELGHTHIQQTGSYEPRSDAAEEASSSPVPSPNSPLVISASKYSWIDSSPVTVPTRRPIRTWTPSSCPAAPRGSGGFVRLARFDTSAWEEVVLRRRAVGDQMDFNATVPRQHPGPRSVASTRAEDCGLTLRQEPQWVRGSRPALAVSERLFDLRSSERGNRGDPLLGILKRGDGPETGCVLRPGERGRRANQLSACQSSPC